MFGTRIFGSGKNRKGNGSQNDQNKQQPINLKSQNQINRTNPLMFPFSKKNTSPNFNDALDELNMYGNQLSSKDSNQTNTNSSSKDSKNSQESKNSNTSSSNSNNSQDIPNNIQDSSDSSDDVKEINNSIVAQKNPEINTNKTNIPHISAPVSITNNGTSNNSSKPQNLSKNPQNDSKTSQKQTTDQLTFSQASLVPLCVNIQMKYDVPFSEGFPLLIDAALEANSATYVEQIDFVKKTLDQVTALSDEAEKKSLLLQQKGDNVEVKAESALSKIKKTRAEINSVIKSDLPLCTYIVFFFLFILNFLSKVADFGTSLVKKIFKVNIPTTKTESDDNPQKVSSTNNSTQS